MSVFDKKDFNYIFYYDYGENYVRNLLELPSLYNDRKILIRWEISVLAVVLVNEK